MNRHLLFACAMTGLLACSVHPISTSPDAGAISDAGSTDGMDAGSADAGPVDAGIVTVKVATGAHIGQSGLPDVTVNVPSGSYSNITLRMHLTSACNTAPPTGMNWPPKCDPYDRLAQVSLADTGGTRMFLLDAVTPFGGEATWDQDITDYYPALFGTHTIHIDVGTYADPSGMATGTESSHDVDVSIILTPGQPPHEVLAVVPIFRQDVTNSSPLSQAITPPVGATDGRVDFFTSGHGGNGAQQCDEFCKKTNNLTVGTSYLFHGVPWVTCDDNCIQVSTSSSSSCGGQTFNYYCKQNPTSCPSSAVAPRSNWCPSKIIDLISGQWPADKLTGSQEVGLQILNVNGDWSVGVVAVFWK